MRGDQGPVVNEAGAVISEDRHYRYRLWRYWSDAPRMVWIMLNPSTATETKDDATLRRCMGYARREGCGGIEVVNLYCLRTAYPTKLAKARENGFNPEEGESGANFAAWKTAFLHADGGRVVAGWGHAATMSGLPASETLARFAPSCKWECLGLTSSGEPRHPVRLSNDRPFVDMPFDAGRKGIMMS